MNKLYIYLLALALLFVGCSEDDLEFEPHNKLRIDNAISSEDDLRKAVDGVYAGMTGSSYYGAHFLTAADMLGDDVVNAYYASNYMDTYANYDWSAVQCSTSLYRSICYYATDINLILELAKDLEETETKEALIAEIKVLRALIHFDLAKIYGPLPVNLGKGKITANALCIPLLDEVKERDDIEGMLRRPVTQIYKFITEEFETYIPLLPTGKITDGRLGQDGAKALLSRIYLYMGEYDLAYKHAKDVMGSYALLSADSYVDSWKNVFTTESIFELIITDNEPSYASIGYYISGHPTNYSGHKEMAASTSFKTLMNQDPNDVRNGIFQYYFGMYLPAKKYPGRDGDPRYNNIKVIRSSELYLIAAECKLKSPTAPDKVEAARLLNELRDHRTSTDPAKYTSATISIMDILHERRLELYAEGHRAWDLWRNQMTVERYTGMITDDYEYDKSGGRIDFDDYRAIYPIAESQIELLPEQYQGSQQNPGY